MSLFVWSNRLAVGPAGRPTSDLRAGPLPAAAPPALIPVEVLHSLVRLPGLSCGRVSGLRPDAPVVPPRVLHGFLHGTACDPRVRVNRAQGSPASRARGRLAPLRAPFPSPSSLIRGRREDSPLGHAWFRTLARKTGACDRDFGPLPLGSSPRRSQVPPSNFLSVVRTSSSRSCRARQSAKLSFPSSGGAFLPLRSGLPRI